MTTMLVTYRRAAYLATSIAANVPISAALAGPHSVPAQNDSDIDAHAGGLRTLSRTSMARAPVHAATAASSVGSGV